jgi:hypothetical protein
MDKTERKFDGLSDIRRCNVHTTIALHKATKMKLDASRAPGQCYNGFLCQLINLWEQSNKGNGRYGMESFSRNNSTISRS